MLWNMHVKCELWVDRCLGDCDGLLVEVGVLRLSGCMYAPGSSWGFFSPETAEFSQMKTDENLWVV